MVNRRRIEPDRIDDTIRQPHLNEYAWPIVTDDLSWKLTVAQHDDGNVFANCEFFKEHGELLQTIKKTDVADHPLVIDHVGLLVNEPPDTTGLLFI